MAFSSAAKDSIYRNAGGQCQCIRQGCMHVGQCMRSLIINTQQSALAQLLGQLIAYPGFEFHHIQSVEAGGADTTGNGAFLCISCHQQTPSYGTNLTGRN